REVEAAGGPVGGRRRRGVAVADDGSGDRAAPGARREQADRGRRECGRGDRRLPRRAAAAVKLLVFLEHRDGAVTKASLGVLAKAAGLGEAAGFVAGSGVRSVGGGVGGGVRV